MKKLQNKYMIIKGYIIGSTISGLLINKWKKIIVPIIAILKNRIKYENLFPTSSRSSRFSNFSL